MDVVEGKGPSVAPAAAHYTRMVQTEEIPLVLEMGKTEDMSLDCYLGTVRDIRMVQDATLLDVASAVTCRAKAF